MQYIAQNIVADPSELSDSWTIEIAQSIVCQVWRFPIGIVHAMKWLFPAHNTSLS